MTPNMGTPTKDHKFADMDGMMVWGFSKYYVFERHIMGICATEIVYSISIVIKYRTQNKINTNSNPKECPICYIMQSSFFIHYADKC